VYQWDDQAAAAFQQQADALTQAPLAIPVAAPAPPPLLAGSAGGSPSALGAWD